MPRSRMDLSMMVPDFYPARGICFRLQLNGRIASFVRAACALWLKLKCRSSGADIAAVECQL